MSEWPVVCGVPTVVMLILIAYGYWHQKRKEDGNL